jgi:glycosyltransferase involved in cell wall biosynthesis
MSSVTQLMERTRHMRVAVVHDWIFVRRGGERVLEQILNLFPHAELHCLLGSPESVLLTKHKHKVITSFLNRIPGVSKIYKLLLPWLPMAAESFNLNGFDLVISSSSCAAKGIIPPPQAKHLCYIHSPMRYAWDQEHNYFPKPVTLTKPLELLRRALLQKLRIWDVCSTARVDLLVANSHFVARRCELYYRRHAAVVHPSVELGRFARKQVPVPRENRVLLFGAWVPYKKMLEALELCVNWGIPVTAAGQGADLQRAAQLYSKNPLVRVQIEPSDAEVAALYETHKVLLFPALEDFGIVPLEAMASGCWVVAPRQGGTGETVVDGHTGTLFELGNVASLEQALRKALAAAVETDALLAHAGSFSHDRFAENLADHILTLLEKG